MSEDMSLKSQIEQAIEPVIKDNFMELVDVEISGGHRSLRIKIDKPGTGVSIDDCTLISRLIGEKLDEEDFIKHEYSLEVSSPGLDRPLKKPEDYKKFAGKRAKIITSEKINGSSVFTGVITGIEDGMIGMEIQKEEVKIDFDLVKKAKLEIDIFK